jgi:hypothetical protein
MNRFKYKLATGLLGLYATIALGAAGSEALRFAECSGLLGGSADTAIRAGSGEGGGDSWQAFLPGMLK